MSRKNAADGIRNSRSRKYPRTGNVITKENPKTQKTRENAKRYEKEEKENINIKYKKKI